MVLAMIFASLLGVYGLIFAVPASNLVFLSPYAKNFMQLASYRLGFGRVKYKLKAQVKFIVKAGISGKLSPADITYESMHSMLLAARVAFPEIDKPYSIHPSRNFYPGHNSVSRLWLISLSLEEVQKLEDLPPAFFVKKTFTLISNAIAVHEAYSEGLVDPMDHKMLEQALDDNAFDTYELWLDSVEAVRVERIERKKSYSASRLKAGIGI